MNKHYTFLVSILTMVGIQSCSPKILPSITTEKKDSIVTIIHERIDTITVTIPIDREIEKIVTRDTTSHLENKYAVSNATVSSGYLCHSLETKPIEIKKPVPVVVHDTLYFEKTDNSEITERVVEVERNFNHWESFLIVCGYILLAVLAIISIFVIIKLIKR